MKILLAFLVSVGSFNTFARDLSAVDKFTSYLPIGNYVGINDQKQACEVSVAEINFPDKNLLIKVTVANKVQTKVIVDKSIFRYRDNKREFIQTDTKSFGADGINYVERIVRTARAENNKQYVTVSYSVVTNTSSETEALDCVVDL